MISGPCIACRDRGTSPPNHDECEGVVVSADRMCNCPCPKAAKARAEYAETQRANVPYHRIDETEFDLGDAAVSCGVVVMAATGKHIVSGEPKPVILFQFADPFGNVGQPVALLLEDHELDPFKKLVVESVDGAVAAAEMLRERS